MAPAVDCCTKRCDLECSSVADIAMASRLAGALSLPEGDIVVKMGLVSDSKAEVLSIEHGASAASDTDSCDSVCSCDSVWSMPGDVVRVEEYEDLIHDIDARAKACELAVAQMQGFQASVTVIEGLPPAMYRRLVLLTSKLHRHSISLRSRLSDGLLALHRFARNLIASDAVVHLEREMHRRAAERDLARLELFEARRQYKAALVQLCYQRSDHVLLRWQRLVNKAVTRNVVRSANVRLRRLNDHVDRQRKVVQHLKSRISRMNKILEVASLTDGSGAVAAAVRTVQGASTSIGGVELPPAVLAAMSNAQASSAVHGGVQSEELVLTSTILGLLGQAGGDGARGTALAGLPADVLAQLEAAVRGVPGELQGPLPGQGPGEEALTLSSMSALQVHRVLVSALRTALMGSSAARSVAASSVARSRHTRHPSATSRAGLHSQASRAGLGPDLTEDSAVGISWDEFAAKINAAGGQYMPSSASSEELLTESSAAELGQGAANPVRIDTRSRNTNGEFTSDTSDSGSGSVCDADSVGPQRGAAHATLHTSRGRAAAGRALASQANAGQSRWSASRGSTMGSSVNRALRGPSQRQGKQPASQGGSAAGTRRPRSESSQRSAGSKQGHAVPQGTNLQALARELRQTPNRLLVDHAHTAAQVYQHMVMAGQRSMHTRDALPTVLAQEFAHRIQAQDHEIAQLRAQLAKVHVQPATPVGALANSSPVRIAAGSPGLGLTGRSSAGGYGTPREHGDASGRRSSVTFADEDMVEGAPGFTANSRRSPSGSSTAPGAPAGIAPGAHEPAQSPSSGNGTSVELTASAASMPRIVQAVDSVQADEHARPASSAHPRSHASHAAHSSKTPDSPAAGSTGQASEEEPAELHGSASSPSHIYSALQQAIAGQYEETASTTGSDFEVLHDDTGDLLASIIMGASRPTQPSRAGKSSVSAGVDSEPGSQHKQQPSLAPSTPRTTRPGMHSRQQQLQQSTAPRTSRSAAVLPSAGNARQRAPSPARAPETVTQALSLHGTHLAAGATPAGTGARATAAPPASRTPASQTKAPLPRFSAPQPPASRQPSAQQRSQRSRQRSGSETGREDEAASARPFPRAQPPRSADDAAQRPVPRSTALHRPASMPTDEDDARLRARLDDTARLLREALRLRERQPTDAEFSWASAALQSDPTVASLLANVQDESLLHELAHVYAVAASVPQEELPASVARPAKTPRRRGLHVQTMLSDDSDASNWTCDSPDSCCADSSVSPWVGAPLHFSSQPRRASRRARQRAQAAQASSGSASAQATSPLQLRTLRGYASDDAHEGATRRRTPRLATQVIGAGRSSSSHRTRRHSTPDLTVLGYSRVSDWYGDATARSDFTGMSESLDMYINMRLSGAPPMTGGALGSSAVARRRIALLLAIAYQKWLEGQQARLTDMLRGLP